MNFTCYKQLVNRAAVRLLLDRIYLGIKHTERE